MRPTATLALPALVAASLVLASCGERSEPADPQSPAAPAQATARPDTARGETAAAEAPASSTAIDCSKVDKADSDRDILGLTLGMSFDEAERVMRCIDQGLEFEVGKTWHVDKTLGVETRQLARVTDGVKCSGRELVMGGSDCQDLRVSGFYPRKQFSRQVYAAFNGLPGVEVLGAVWRTRLYAEGEKPPVEDLVAALQAKYGEPNFTGEGRRGERLMGWVYDQRGRPMSPARQEFQTCSQGVQPGFAGSHRWSAACSFGLHVLIKPNYQNPLVVDELSASMMDQGAFMQATEAFEAALAAHQKARQQAELEAARDNAPAAEL